MPLLDADCPRCGTKKTSFNVKSFVHRGTQYEWKQTYEIFSECRSCRKPTIFRISQNISGQINPATSSFSTKISKFPYNLLEFNDSLNLLFDIEGHVSLKDQITLTAPEHLSKEIGSAFTEAAACYAIGCYNAAGAMFRLCLDLVTRPCLPVSADTSVKQPNSKERRDLGLRLQWLFDNGHLPTDLRELAQAIREEGNDGAHAGILTKADIEDILDFTIALLQRLVTEPAKLRLAQERRAARRAAKE